MMVQRHGMGRVARYALAGLALALAGCGQDAGPPQAGEAPAVQTVTVRPEPYTLSTELPGRIEPVRVAEVRARVAGIVLKRNFEEGADVKAGDVLFQIDPAPFRAALSRAQGQLAQAEATLFDAQAVVRRNQPLVKIEAVSRQEFDAATARLKSAQAARQSARADVETAQLNLDYATVTAPISGRIGRALVTEGALVGQNEATPLATIQQLDPVYADFRQPIADVLRMREALAAGRLAQDADKRARIAITVDGTDKTRAGHLLFSDITVDRSTGQVALRGVFDNADGLLLPGMYVRVYTQQGTDPKALLVPQRAVQRNTDGGAQVLVVDGDSKAQVREVVTGTMQGARWHIVSGLADGDRVIVGGAARAGEPVQVAAQPEAAPRHAEADATPAATGG